MRSRRGPAVTSSRDSRNRSRIAGTGIRHPNGRQPVAWEELYLSPDEAAIKFEKIQGYALPMFPKGGGPVRLDRDSSSGRAWRA